MDALIYLLWTNFELITLLSPQCTFRYYESGYKLVYYHVNKSKYISCEDICIKEGIDSYIHVTCLYIVYVHQSEIYKSMFAIFDKGQLYG